jgi:WD40 repeat protein
VRAVNFSQDGTSLITASDDKTAKVRLAASNEYTHLQNMRRVVAKIDYMYVLTGM